MRKTSTLCSSLLVVFSFLGNVHAQQRTLLYPQSLSGDILKLSDIIRDPKSKKVDPKELPRASRYFVRISPRAAVFDGKKLKDTAILAAPAKPFVFLTTPEGIFGRSLLEIYEDIGYEAEGILQWNRNEDMVAILFRYPNDISISELKDGNFLDNWRNQIYPTTWANVFSLFTRLVQPESELCKGHFPALSICLPPLQASFVLGFPIEGKQRIKNTEYTMLRAIGGSDWEYRKLLESKLSVFEHFRGNGETQNEVLDPDAKEPGLPEVVGPNKKIKELAEVAIIHLGKLLIEDCYSSTLKNPPKCEDP